MRARWGRPACAGARRRLPARMGSRLPFISVWAVMARVAAVRRASGASAAGGNTPRRPVRPGCKRECLDATNRAGHLRRKNNQLSPARYRYPWPIHGNCFGLRHLKQSRPGNSPARTGCERMARTMKASDEFAFAHDLELTMLAGDRELILFAFATVTGAATSSFSLGERPKSGAALQRPRGFRPASFRETARNTIVNDNSMSRRYEVR